MKPVLKWPGGKSTELAIIKQFMPENYDCFVEPFLGGGALYFNLEHQNNLVNDFNQELISFYQMIQDSDKLNHLIKIIHDFILKREQILNVSFKDKHWKNKILDIINDPLYDQLVEKELKKRLYKIEQLKTKPSDQEVHDYKITGLCAALYYVYRDLYNKKNVQKVFDVEHIAYWFLMRELCYSSMFRYSKTGHFNVPYGGLSYNQKSLSKKLDTMTTMNQEKFFNNTNFENLDFEGFFTAHNYFSEQDFIFVDPPYDTDFSQYNKDNDFVFNDQKRLANTLIRSNAQVLMIIKNTDFIYNLYNNDQFKIQSFDKNYSVNFRNRNKQNVNHLIIKNYD